AGIICGHARRGRARHVAVLRAALRPRRRGGPRGRAGAAAVAGPPRPAHRAHARQRRAHHRGRARRGPRGPAPSRERHRGPRRHARAVGRSRARGARLSLPVRAERRPARARAVALMLEVLGWPLLAALVLAAVHAWLGLHVLARGVIFVDLALAQVAALGVTVALVAGHAADTNAAYWYALLFTAGGAALLAALRDRPRLLAAAIPQEALIGIVYAVAAALTVLVLERVPLGGEQIKALLVGSLLAVTRDDVLRVAALYGAVGVAHWLARRPLAALSFGGMVPRARLWDFAFYLTFGLVVTSSVRIAGVLLVFAYLIVPAVVGAALASTPARRLATGWLVGS